MVAMMKINFAYIIILVEIIISSHSLNIMAQNTPVTFNNPILSGFHPDPSIVRVGEDYYMVNSTFEWFPGMPIHHSKDLVNWSLIGYGLHRTDQVLLQEGLGDYMGIFAATIRYRDGIFYLITTCVQCRKSGNFYITAKNPAGPWSDPVWLDSPGIDPSLMWDSDGKSYYTGHGNLNKIQEWPDQQGVWIQEINLNDGTLIGPRKQLTHGHANNAVWAEGPHIYKINGKYLLMLAEGGTSTNHAITVHHSDSIFGPYIADQINPVLTHRHLGNKYPFHSIGHADLVETQNGEWWAVMLGKRYIDNYTLLARETFLTPVVFEGQTPIFNPGKGMVEIEHTRPNLPWSPVASMQIRDEFSGKNLDLEWNFLRSPVRSWHELRGGELILNLRKEVLNDLVNPSLIARRIEHTSFSASTKLTFNTAKESERAGLVIYRRSRNHFQFLKDNNELVLIRTLKGIEKEIIRMDYTEDTVILRAETHGRRLVFSYGKSEKEMMIVNEEEDMNVISYELSEGFNGPYIGIYATSMGQESDNKAFFDWFEYTEK